MNVSQFTWNNERGCLAMYRGSYIRLRLRDNCTRRGPNVMGQVSNHRREKNIKASFIIAILLLSSNRFD